MIYNIPVNTKTRAQFVDITKRIQEQVAASKVEDGVCYIYVPHTTAGITINENADPSVVGDIISHLSQLVPNSDKFSHMEGNSDSHIKASLLGSCVTVFIEDNELVLGTWQGIYFAEFDGPRSREVFVKIISG